jgi:ATP-dependent Clp protease ATP-binding subunit ClpA/post-segregation antitoxin (ccd killing protein)
MPKINVYLPDDLADAVREAGLPVSAICQRALEGAVRRVSAIREAALARAPDDSDPIGSQSRFTDRARTVARLAFERARSEDAPGVGTEHLLGGILGEGGNLAIRLLAALEIAPEQVERELARNRPATEPGTELGEARGFTASAASALELAVAEALSLGHNYVGCEHLLLGLIAEPDGIAGHVLRALGAEQRLARRAVMAALAGVVHLRSQDVEQKRAGAEVLSNAIRAQLQPIVDRLARVEAQLGLGQEHPG